jgi:cysteate synthase
MSKYQLECLACHKSFNDMYQLSCNCQDGGFLRSIYHQTLFNPSNEKTIWRFKDWLPVENPPSNNGSSKTQISHDAGKTVVYKSEILAREIGLENLFIAFNGYWPEKKANMFTCSFKGLEAPPTICRAKDNGIKQLLIATAGNTGRAFAEESINQDFRIIIVAPHSANSRLWTTKEISNGHVKYISLKEGNDYTEAILLGKRICEELQIRTEGGAKNVARRDGMGTCFLEAVNQIGYMPHHYFQAIGSGTGGIAAWEAALRIVEDGRFGNYLPKLHLSQNEKFDPIVRAWNARRSSLISEDFQLSSEKMSSLYAEVLANRNPPYSNIGGVNYALRNTNGLTYSVSEKEAREAAALFHETEGIDILPAAAVAMGSLLQAIEQGSVLPEEAIVLNITGGGLDRLEDDFDKIPINADITIPSNRIELDEIEEVINN